MQTWAARSGRAGGDDLPAVCGRGIAETMRQGFTAEPAGLWLRLIFLALALVLSAVGAYAFADADRPLTPLPSFLPAFASAVIICDLVTAYLILVHAPLAGRWSLLWLGGGYVFSGTMVIAQMLVFPGVWSPTGLFGASPQSAVWIWAIWHLGFPAFVIVSMLALRWERRGDVRRRLGYQHAGVMVAAVLAIVAAVLVLATRGESLLPQLIDGDRFQHLPSSPQGAIVVFLNVAALVAVVWVTRCRSVLDLGLSVAVFASLIDVVLTLRSGTRFSLGWYAGRIGSVLPALSVLAVYLREVTFLYSRVTRLNERLEEQVALDVTTGLFNRRHFNLQLESVLADAREPVSLLLIDVDHFKLYNDHYGHLAGDECLRRVAEAIRGTMRQPSDLVARFGGEEFAVILPATEASAADLIARRIVRSFNDLPLEHKGSPTARVVTVSVGIGTVAPGAGFEQLVRQADVALYRAKESGRNRVA